MRPRQHQLPPLAPETTREAILVALHNEAYSITGYGRRYLVEKNFNPEAVVAALIEYIESGYRVYLLMGPSISGLKYQCCLNFEGFTVHTKIFKGEESAEDSWHVVLSFHNHDTGAPPYPK